MKKRWTKLWQDNKSFLLFITLMLMFRSALADWNEVPTGSMKPTIIEGDRIWVNKMAYDVRLPFTHLSLVKLGDPARGDIIVFDSQRADKKLVKRVVGVPGDIVEMRDNRLSINGVDLSYETTAFNDNTRDEREHLSDAVHAIRIKNDAGPMANFPAVRVPEGQYLALGDNRDNSADSRVIGFIPRDEIVGRATSVVISLNYDNYYLPRGDRFFHAL